MEKSGNLNVSGLVASIVIGIFFLIITFVPSPSSDIIKDTNSTSTKVSNKSSESSDVKGAKTESSSENKKTNSTSSQSAVLAKATKGAVEVQKNSPTPTFKTASGVTFPLRTYKTLAPNDPNATQWWTTSTGLDAAWNIGTGATQTTVAVIDTGFGLNHEEFTNRWAINNGEQGIVATENISQLNCSDQGFYLDQACNMVDDDFDEIVDNESGSTTIENPSQLNCTDQGIALNKSCNLIDDDSNGYVDDVRGWDFVNYDPSVQAGETNPSGTGTTHGTETTGILAATGNNSKGIAGVNWSTKVLPIQAIDDDSYGNTLTVARAVYYAADRGVDVISLSLGSDEEDSYLRQAIQYALDRDVLVVAASGNDGCNCLLYPAQYPEVLAVGSHNQSGAPSSFSSYGANLDILAPGENMQSTTWIEGNPTSSYVSGINGTSFATPYTSGLLSLARSHQPNASWGELVNALLMTANHTGLTAANPTSLQTGSGYVKADNLISRATTSAAPGMRYIFEPTTSAGALGSSRIYQCYQAGDFPTAPLYEINNSSSIYYTIDALESIRAANSGYAVNNIGRACVGLPTDAPVTIRNINLLREVRNLTNYKL